jgi:hypothetical protein
MTYGGCRLRAKKVSAILSLTAAAGTLELLELLPVHVASGIGLVTLGRPFFSRPERP